MRISNMEISDALRKQVRVNSEKANPEIRLEVLIRLIHKILHEKAPEINRLAAIEREIHKILPRIEDNKMHYKSIFKALS